MDAVKTATKIKRNIRSFEADEDVDLLLSAAQRDGIKLARLCNLALRTYGRQIVREELAKQGRRASDWAKIEKLIPPVQPSDEQLKEARLQHEVEKTLSNSKIQDAARGIRASAVRKIRGTPRSAK